MTTEIQEYKCPSCGQLLGQQEYLHACEIFQKELTEKLQQRDNRHAKEIQQKDVKFKQEVESIVESRMNEERAKDRQEAVDKENKHRQEIEAIRSQAMNFANERIRQADFEKEAKYRQTEEQYKEKIKRLDDDNRNLQKQVEEQRKRLDTVPGHLSGQAGENILFEELKQAFSPPDVLTCKKNGVAMADIVHVIVTEKGELIRTPIVYDKKTGDKLTNGELENAKDYMRIHSTDYCIIVTKDIKDEKRYTEERDGVLLVRPAAVVDIARGIRKSLIEASKLAKTISGIESKKDRLYEFFTSSEYNRDLHTRLEGKLKLDELQKREEEYHRRTWNVRRELIHKWDELDSKFEGWINDMTQEENREDGESSPSL